MAAKIDNAVFDAALNVIKTNGDLVHILTSEVTSWASIAAASLGNAVPSYASIADGTSGRKLVMNAISDANVTATGTATHFAITDGSSLVYVCQALNASQGVTSGNKFSLTACTIQIDDPVA